MAQPLAKLSFSPIRTRSAHSYKCTHALSLLSCPRLSSHSRCSVSILPDLFTDSSSKHSTLARQKKTKQQSHLDTPYDHTLTRHAGTATLYYTQTTATLYYTQAQHEQIFHTNTLHTTTGRNDGRPGFLQPVSCVSASCVSVSSKEFREYTYSPSVAVSVGVGLSNSSSFWR